MFDAIVAPEASTIFDLQLFCIAICEMRSNTFIIRLFCSQATNISMEDDAVFNLEICKLLVPLVLKAI